MFVYFSKRIAIPNGTLITSISWNEEQSWLATGCANGLLKVLRVDGNVQSQRASGLSINQTLEGHETAVSLVSWNQHYRKLTSSDDSGKIIVWTLHKGMWFEEMVNNRNKSRVVDLSWNMEGTKICIAYEDGAVIVGSVEGNRLWGRDYNYELAKVCWSADDKYLLLGTVSGEVYVHDVNAGHLVSQVNVQCEEKNVGKLAGLAWHPAWVERPEPYATFAICYTSGKVQLMNSIGDENPYLFDAGISTSHIEWNPQGTILAISGSASGNSLETSVIITHFYNNEGKLLRSLRVTGKHCGGITWEGDGLRVAIAVDSSVYFADIRPCYKYCYFKKTLVFSFARHDKVEQSVMFWNVKSNERFTKSLRELIYINACKDACVMVSKPDPKRQQYMIQLLSAVGSPIDTRFITVEPLLSCMNSSHVVCCSDENVYMWQFRDPSIMIDDLDPISVQASRNENEERVFHIDDIIRADTPKTMNSRSALTNNFTCTIDCNEVYLLLARNSGLMHVYQLEPLQLLGKLIIPPRALMIRVNSDSSCFCVIDASCVLRAFKLDRNTLSLIPRKAEAIDNFERKDAWDVIWALDNPNQLAVMEKARMFIYTNFVPEEPIQSSANLCKFSSHKIRAVQFDDLMLDPERPRKEFFVELEDKVLRGLRSTMSSNEVKKVYDYAYQQNHPKIWKLLAEFALSKLDFTYAEMAFIECKDYPAIQFIKRVRALDDARKQLAEIHTYYYRFDDAERIYKEMDRKDLAVELRSRIGDWFGVVRLVQEGGGDESLLYKAWENIGDEYANHQKWSKAGQYYTQCKNYRKLANVFYAMEDYEMLAQLIPMLEHDKPLLLSIGHMFANAGVAESAANAFIAAGEAEMAVNACVEVNMWEKAIAVAEEHHTKSVSELLRKYARQLITRERIPEAIELYRKAGQHADAGKLLSQLGNRVLTLDILRAKKFYVLSALEIEKYRSKTLTLNRGGSDAVEELLNDDHSTANHRTIDTAWRGAEACHFYLMCQQHIYERNFDTALTVAMRLTEYDDLIRPVNCYSLIALSAYLTGNFGVCSNAFTKLEMLERNDEIAQLGTLHAAVLSSGDGDSDSEGDAEKDTTAAAAAAAAAAVVAAATQAATVQLTHFSMDLDVTQRNTSSLQRGTNNVSGMPITTSSSPSSSMITATLNSLQATSTTSSAMMSAPLITGSNSVRSKEILNYPTVHFTDPPRRFAQLATDIFIKHAPLDTSKESVSCTHCGTFNKEWAARCVQCQEQFAVCIVTGVALVDDDEIWECSVCQHKALESAIEKYKNCPLCHAARNTRSRHIV